MHRRLTSTKTFNEKTDVKLINLVKDNPVLYDFNNPKYMDFNTREVTWQKVGDRMKLPANDCKVRWINIRDVNRRILKKSLCNPGQRVRLYKYENELSFMRPFYKDVQMQSPVFESDDNNDNNDNNDDNDDIDNDNQASDEQDVNINTDEDYVEEKPVRKVKKKSTKGRKKKMKRSISYEEEEPVASVFNETTASSELDPGDSVDAFLLSIGATLKTFTPYHLNIAKSKIFSVVQEHDLQQIVQRQRDGSDVKVSTSDPIFLQ